MRDKTLNIRKILLNLVLKGVNKKLMELSCVVIDDEPSGITMVEDLIGQTAGTALRSSFDNAFDALNYLHTNGPVDVVFSDISMPFINGIEAAKLLDAHCRFLIFITAHRDYGPEAFEVNADGYLLKPLMKTRFLELVHKLLKEKSKADERFKDDRVLLIKGGLKNNYLNVLSENILYIKALANYVQIYGIDGVKTTYMGLIAVEHALEGNRAFLKINRSTIIAVNKIHHIDGYTVVMNDEAKFTVGKQYKLFFNEFLSKRVLNP
ncbi:response regulator transcription factor [Pedobacter agri]|uniref:LytR/AlgR family response regulator transcription factor n=1 Tax=Pedobacter agri TaxID=454586 RepID=UPI00292DEBD7|nr:response regulator transcription factor [Pedobacter agri]